MSDEVSLVPGAAHARYLGSEARRIARMSREELLAEGRAYLERHGLSAYLPVEAAPVEAAPVEAVLVEAVPVEAAPVEAVSVEAAPSTPPARAAARARGPGVSRAEPDAQLPLFARRP